METRVRSTKNPVIPGRGVCDPHVRVFGGMLYLYASHDASIDNPGYRMNDWQIWRTADAIDWELMATVRPEDTYMGASDACWATDAAVRDGQYYFYFSNGNHDTGVLRGPTPYGPFADVLGRPLIAESTTPTMEYDPHIFIDDDAGRTPYIVFGGPSWAYGDRADGYYIARLGEDMMSLAETPRRLDVNHRGDDNVSLHKWKDTYYLTWASHVATSGHVYGPYAYRGNIGAAKDHGTFFYWNHQWFNAFTIFDPTLVHRASGLCYVHYEENGDMAPVDSLIVQHGVGHYDAGWHRISAAWYMRASRYLVRRGPNGGFEAAGMTDEDFIMFPNVQNIPAIAEICVFAACTQADARIEISEGGRVVGTIDMPAYDSPYRYITYVTPLTIAPGKHSLTFTVRGANASVAMDAFRIYAKDRLTEG